MSARFAFVAGVLLGYFVVGHVVMEVQGLLKRGNA